MRTTLTIEPDVEFRLRKEMRRTGKGPKETVNEALRRGLGLTPDRSAKRYVVQSHDFGLKPGLDRDRMNQLADELEAEETVKKYHR